MILVRTEYADTRTRGVLVLPDGVFHTLELPWKDNERAVSCIPVGTYESVYLPLSASGKYRATYHLQQVDSRSGILIHNGNVVGHTDGCILVGLTKGTLYGEAAVLQSRKAMLKLNQLMNKQNFILEIRDI
jgi:hypothetical protein